MGIEGSSIAFSSDGTSGDSKDTFDSSTSSSDQSSSIYNQIILVRCCTSAHLFASSPVEAVNLAVRCTPCLCNSSSEYSLAAIGCLRHDHTSFPAPGRPKLGL